MGFIARSTTRSAAKFLVGNEKPTLRGGHDSGSDNEDTEHHSSFDGLRDQEPTRAADNIDDYFGSFGGFAKLRIAPSSRREPASNKKLPEHDSENLDTELEAAFGQMHVQQPTTAATAAVAAVKPLEAITPKAVVEETKEADKNSESSTNDRAPPMLAVQTLDRQEAEEKAMIRRVELTMQKLHRDARKRLESEAVNLENTSTLSKLQDRRVAMERQIKDSIQEFAEERDESLTEIFARYQAQRQVIIQQAQHQVAAAEQGQFHVARTWQIQMQARAEAERAAMEQARQEAARISYIQMLQDQAEAQRLATINQAQSQMRAAEAWYAEAHTREIRLEEERAWIAQTRQAEAIAREHEDARARNLHFRQIQEREQGEARCWQLLLSQAQAQAQAQAEDARVKELHLRQAQAQAQAQIQAQAQAQAEKTARTRAAAAAAEQQRAQSEAQILQHRQQHPLVQQIPPPAIIQRLEPLYQNLVPMLGKRKRETFLPSNVETGNQAKRQKCSGEFRAADDAANEPRAHSMPINDSAVELTANTEVSSESRDIASPDHQSSSSRGPTPIVLGSAMPPTTDTTTRSTTGPAEAPMERGVGAPSSRRDNQTPAAPDVDDERNRAKKRKLSGGFRAPEPRGNLQVRLASARARRARNALMQAAMEIRRQARNARGAT